MVCAAGKSFNKCYLSQESENCLELSVLEDSSVWSFFSHMHFCKTLKKDTEVSSRVKKDTKNQLLSCRCICGACSPVLLSVSSYCHYRSQHRPGQWLCQKACLALRHISELPPPNRITPLNPRLARPLLSGRHWETSSETAAPRKDNGGSISGDRIVAWRRGRSQK